MSWALLAGIVSFLGMSIVVAAFRRRELASLSRNLSARAHAVERGSHSARLQYPHVDLSRCGGCGLCIEACPEEGVLELIHGQAIVVHGARCVGHGQCARECPVDAITVVLGDLEERRDIPALGDSFEAHGTPGLFLAGEVTGYALIKTAIEHGKAVAAEVARRTNGRGGRKTEDEEETLDLCVVGAGPAGLACSLEAKAQGLQFLTIDRESLGGTVAKYPRRKLVMTQPVELPGYGRLSRATYSKEELMDLWETVVASNDLPIRSGVEFLGSERRADGSFHVRTSAGDFRARHLCLAVGRRGTPRKLNVPGEELPKVVYGLIDAQSFVGRDVLVVGGGDSAVEAALALSARGGNRVTLSYRRHAFFRIKAGNEAGLEQAQREGRLRVEFESEVLRIAPDHVELILRGGDEERCVTLPNDDILVLAGGVPPFPMLEKSGVSFDPAHRPATAKPTTRGTGLLRGLLVAFLLSLGTAAWILWHFDYYDLERAARPDSPWHALLRPSAGVGLALGIAAAVFVSINLAYLVRRSPRLPLTFGSLRAWMTTHVVTGVLALLLALVHGAMKPENSVGGHALVGLAVLLATGAIGRYFYAWIPRAANGRELDIEEARRSLSQLSAEWKRVHAEYGERALAIVTEIVPHERWRGSFAARVLALLRARTKVRAAVDRLRVEGRRRGVAPSELDRFQTLADRAVRTLLAVSHYEDLRALLATWRWVHRWTALLVVILIISHVVAALRYASLFS